MEVQVSKLEAQEILKAYLKKVSLQNLLLPWNKELSVGFGTILTKNVAISDLIFNEDLIQIDLIEESKSMKVFIRLDSFALRLNADITTKVLLNFSTQLDLEIFGLQIEATLLLQKNQIIVQNEKFDKFSIKQIKIKEGEGVISNLIKKGFNELLNLFNKLINDFFTNKIVQFFKQDKWRNLLPSYISEVQFQEVINSENLKFTFSVNNSEVIAKISQHKPINDI
ncbi:unnamed protein product (macronuclear) [Paramecium tetraurelia]|uniref:SMP-LTD domain-containing protein n=1 Tax=Paramecium tetraurelia TaxID=5888 RepID=A0C3D3_PARTE|nr:uncharacterized protein GSPATT00034779001 [Paramecium tetraurelia]CAK65300.1 unnamed protein product [Paramecium tetraurelia]|eukprot:XP_001432697.1 hypothetical protein (macronuclear) [Paramecium tetraurelia strain d4-2]